VRVTVIATGFDDGHREATKKARTERDRPAFGRSPASDSRPPTPRRSEERTSFDVSGDVLDVPSFLKDS